jgi:hypothetical protein
MYEMWVRHDILCYPRANIQKSRDGRFVSRSAQCYCFPAPNVTWYRGVNGFGEPTVRARLSKTRILLVTVFLTEKKVVQGLDLVHWLWFGVRCVQVSGFLWVIFLSESFNLRKYQHQKRFVPTTGRIPIKKDFYILLIRVPQCVLSWGYRGKSC